MDKTLFNLRRLVAILFASVIQWFVTVLRAFRYSTVDHVAHPPQAVPREINDVRMRVRAFRQRCLNHSQFHAGGFDALYHSP